MPSQDLEIIECEVVDNALGEAMEAKKLSQERCAARSRMTTRQLGRIMHMKNTPSLKRAMALSVVLGRSIDSLFKFRIKTRRAIGDDNGDRR